MPEASYVTVPTAKSKTPTKKPRNRQSVSKRERVVVYTALSSTQCLFLVSVASFRSALKYLFNENRHGRRDSGEWTRKWRRCARNRAHHQGEFEFHGGRLWGVPAHYILAKDYVLFRGGFRRRDLGVAARLLLEKSVCLLHGC